MRCETRFWCRLVAMRSGRRRGFEISSAISHLPSAVSRLRCGLSMRPDHLKHWRAKSWTGGPRWLTADGRRPGMRIGITCYPTYGGSGAVATELGLELARRGYEVHFISYASPFRLRGYAERVTFHQVTQTEYPLFEQSSPYALALAVKQHEVAMRESLDIMHVHYAIPHAATAWLAKQMLKSQRDLKLVTTLHGPDIILVGQDPSYYTLTKFSIEQSDRVTAVSAFLREETCRAFGCGQCEVRVIPHYVSTA